MRFTGIDSALRKLPGIRDRQAFADENPSIGLP
jgi:hypothetical protein